MYITLKGDLVLLNKVSLFLLHIREIMLFLEHKLITTQKFNINKKS